MKRIGSALLWLAGVYFVASALFEPFTIDFGDPSTYQHDLGGPSLIGVLFVHCGLGVLAAALMAWRLMRSSSLRLQADRSAPPPDGDADRPQRVLSMAGVGAGPQERGGEGHRP